MLGPRSNGDSRMSEAALLWSRPPLDIRAAGLSSGRAHEAQTAMTGRRGDGYYFGLLAAVLGLALWIGGREEEGVAAETIDFSFPGVQLEIPFELPFAEVRFKRPAAPRLRIGQDTEGVIVEVRRNLLESSSRDAEDVEVALDASQTAQPQLAAAFD